MINPVPLSRSIDIPFNKLVLSQANVRQINAGQSIDDLAQDIATRGLLQSLNVRPIVDEAGNETGKYEIPAGGRRYRALGLLVKTKRLAKTALIPCVIKACAVETSLEDDSLAENTHRTALHPLDQFRAFLALRRQGMSEDDIAARYFVGVNIVKQRLRLASVSQVLMELYAQEDLTLDQLMAFSVTSDHARQEQVWANLPTWERQPFQIRRALTEGAVSATDRRAVFVGVQDYEAAGGEVLRDLFSADSGGQLKDPVLLDRLAIEKLEAIAQNIKIEGWKWIEVLPNLPFDHLHGLRKIEPAEITLSDGDAAALVALKGEYHALNEALAEEAEIPEACDQRLGELETAIETLELGIKPTFDPGEIARAGVIVSIGRGGQAEILRGYIRAEDELPVGMGETDQTGSDTYMNRSESVETTIISLGGSASVLSAIPEDDESDVLRPLPEKLILELTAFKTIALRDAVARHPHVAMTLLLHRLVSDIFGHRNGGSCLQAFISLPTLHNIAPKGLDETVPATTMARRRELWGETFPGDDQALWDWLNEQTNEVRGELLAFCVAYGVTAISERVNPNSALTQQSIDVRLKHAARLSDATDLDLVALGWRPTAENYLNRVPRPRILEAVREGCGDRAAQLIDHMKKGEMAVEAERLLAESGWLPEPLRDASVDSKGPLSGSADLPSFLDDRSENDTGGEFQPSIAAE